MEQQCTAGLTEWQIAEFLEDHEIRVSHTIRNSTGFTVHLVLFKRIDELNGRQEPHAPMVVDYRLDPDGSREMRLAGARSTNEHDIPGVVEELTARQGPDLAFRDHALGEVEAGEILMRREFCDIHLIVDRPHLALSDLA